MRRRTTLGLALAAVAGGAAKDLLAAGAPGRPARSTAGNKPLPKNEAEKKVLAVLDDMYENQRRGMMNVPPDDGRLLRVLAEFGGARHAVEIGTSNGYSGVWTCLGLVASGGKLTTFEIDAGRAALARENFKRAGVDALVTLVEGDAHKEVGKIGGPLDFVFLDADKEGYADYLKQLVPKVRPGGLVLAHNASSHERALADYLAAVTANPDLETVFVNMQGAGISLTLKKR
jgi:predicted O-methyltransferase YrrM